MLEDIAKWGLCPMIVSFKTLINGYCKSGDLKEGFRLKRVMEESGMRLDAFTYNVWLMDCVRRVNWMQIGCLINFMRG